MTETSPSPPRAEGAAAPRRFTVREAVGTAAGVFLGALYLVAAWAKAITPDAFAEQIRVEGLDFLLPAMAVALVALALEAGLGVALMLALRRLWVLVPTALLTVFFLVLTGRAWYLSAHGLREDVAGCGCFGNLVERSPAEAFWQDLLLLGLPTVLAFLGLPRGARRFPPLRTALVVVAAVAAPVLAWQAPGLPLDDLATRLKPGAEVADFCAGEGDQRVCLDLVVPSLAQGEHLVVLADLEDEAFTAEVERLNEYATAARGDDSAPPLTVLSSAAPEVHRGFFWRHGPVFEVHEVPEAVIRPLYRRLPRSFEVEDGRVTKTWPGLPPAGAAEEAGGEAAGAAQSED
ncbi:MAG TPA: MauE/DoxX family redox-associated membrane protein [Thermoanaerobaculia bacterium]|nr:MauE/DoxX family redox-associated membrane protein [Thermoanaerobaculia bacterium]